MIPCVYVGGDSSVVGEREFDEVGQKAAFSEELFHDVVAGGAAFIPQAEFDKVGFNADDLNMYGGVAMRPDAPTKFHDALHRAQQIFRDIRAGVTMEDRGKLDFSREFTTA